MSTRPVVVGTDGSAESMLAVEWAAREAELRGAPLQIVSVAEVLPRMTLAPHVVDIETVASSTYKHRDEVLVKAAQAATAMAPGLEVGTSPLDGPPGVAVTHAGDDALMLVVGSRGNGAFAALVLGSVGRYAALHASCPVVVVREETVAAHPQIVVGIRDPQDCAAALGFAFEEAALRHASLLAVHAWQSPRVLLPEGPGELRDARATTALDELMRTWRAKYPDVETSQDIVHGHPGRVLAGLSATADLVVLGRRGTHGPAGVTHAVLSHAHGPVITVPQA
jgi:nucleotide-binding universal stress UspA family protein